MAMKETNGSDASNPPTRELRFDASEMATTNAVVSRILMT
jgi:hypothetical protein